MNTLVAVGTGAAFTYSAAVVLFPQWTGQSVHVYFETAAVIITLILLGRLLEFRAKRKTNYAIKNLLSLKPKFAAVIENGIEIKRKIDELKTGDIVLTRPGKKFQQMEL